MANCARTHRKRRMKLLQNYIVEDWRNERNVRRSAYGESRDAMPVSRLSVWINGTSQVGRPLRYHRRAQWLVSRVPKAIGYGMHGSSRSVDSLRRFHRKYLSSSNWHSLLHKTKWHKSMRIYANIHIVHGLTHTHTTPIRFWSRQWLASIVFLSLAGNAICHFNFFVCARTAKQWITIKWILDFIVCVGWS